MKRSTDREVKQVHKLMLTGEDIVSAVTNMFDCEELEKALAKKNKHLKVYFEVPGGGDWSNMDVDIDEDNPVIIKVEWMEHETT